MHIRKTGLRNELACHFYTDAADFLERFDLLYEEYSKTKRFKCFVDLLMGFECILKSHIFLSHKSSNMEELYRCVRKAGHNLNKLADLASFSSEEVYQEIKDELSEYSVFIRYSLDAYENFLPSSFGYGQGKFNYFQTMTNYTWMMKVRDLLNSLVSSTSDEFSGFVNFNFNKFFEEQDEINRFVEKIGVTKGKA